jgi:uncharacterized membrane-anchored protein YhcB (DUF1043 family)
MKAIDTILLQSFLNALSQLDEPLPPETQKQLNEFGESLTDNSTNIGRLDTIAKTYQPLYEFYQTELTSLTKIGAEKSKAIESKPSKENSNQNTPETTNAARDAFNDTDSVAAAKKLKKSENIFNKIGNWLGRNK